MPNSNASSGPRRFQILVVGVGSIGERHVRCFLGTGRADVAICEINEPLAREVAERYGLRRRFGTLDEAIEQGEFDAAVVCTPAHLHLQMAGRWLDTGGGLLIEKPLSTSLEGVGPFQERLAGCSPSPLVGVAYVLRNHPILADMSRALASGEFGRPLQIVGVGGQHFPTYRPAYREIYYARHETGGGAIQDALTHMMNAAQWLVGKVDRLVADAEHLALPGVEVEDTVQVLARHGSVLGSFSLNQHQPANESTITVVCEKGMARFEMHRGRWQSVVQPEAPWQTRLEIQLQRDDLFVRQAEAFLDALAMRDATRLPCNLSEAVHTLAINTAILRSWRQGTWQSVEGRL